MTVDFRCSGRKSELFRNINELHQELREKKKELLNNWHPLVSILAEARQKSRGRIFAALKLVREKMKFTGGGIL